MTSTNRIKTILGDEFDDALRIKLLNVLRGLGAFTAGPGERYVVGSQDIEKLKVLINAEVLHVEAETYIGLSIERPFELVSRIQRIMET